MISLLEVSKLAWILVVKHNLCVSVLLFLRDKIVYDISRDEKEINNFLFFFQRLGSGNKPLDTPFVKYLFQKIRILILLTA